MTSAGEIAKDVKSEAVYLAPYVAFSEVSLDFKSQINLMWVKRQKYIIYQHGYNLFQLFTNFMSL